MEEKLFKEFDEVSREEWQAKIITDLKGKPYAGLKWQTAGLSGEPVYTKEDLPEKEMNLANQHEKPEIFGARHWVNYQLLQVKEEKAANKKALHALENGAGGLVFVLTAQPNWTELLSDIQLAYCHIGIDDRSGSKGLLDSFIVYAQGQFDSPGELQGFYRGDEVTLPNHSAGGFKYISLSPEAIGEQVPAIELAWLLASAAASFHKLTDAGHTAESLISHTQLELSMGNSYFAEIAKYRAMRGVFVQFARAYGSNIAASDVTILAQSSDWSARLDDPHSHMLSATTQAMSAIIGGTDGLCIQPFYPVFEKNEALAERAARNISSILSEESYLNKVVDPAAGTYYIESLTQQLMKESWQLFLLIEEAGGIQALDPEGLQSLHQKTIA